MVFQLEVYYKVDRFLTGLTAQWYSNKTSLHLKSYKIHFWFHKKLKGIVRFGVKWTYGIILSMKLWRVQIDPVAHSSIETKNILPYWDTSHRVVRVSASSLATRKMDEVRFLISEKVDKNTTLHLWKRYFDRCPRQVTKVIRFWGFLHFFFNRVSSTIGQKIRIFCRLKTEIEEGILADWVRFKGLNRGAELQFFSKILSTVCGE